MRNIFTLVLLFFIFSANAQDGTLDPTYGSGGKQINENWPRVLNADREHIVVLPDNKFLQVYPADSTNVDFAIARFNEDGSLDNTFGINGVVVTDFGGDDVPTSITITSDNKILVAGYTNNGTSNQFAVARYSINGVPDVTFDTDGKLIPAIPGGDEAVYSVEESAGSILLAGYSTNPGDGEAEFTIAKLTSTGAFDPSFGGGDGIVTTSIGTIDVIYDIDLMPDGRILAVGYTNNLTNTFFTVARYTSTGALDNTFNFGGPVNIWIGDGVGVANSVDIDAVTGDIIVAGQAEVGGNVDMALVRLNTDGTFDNSFDGDGVLTRAIGSDVDIAYDVLVQPDGKILVAGTSQQGATDNDYFIARYTPTGTLDGNFNPSGTTPGLNIIDFGNSSDTGYDIAYQGSNIIFAGVTGIQLSSARLINGSSTLPAYIVNFAAVKQGGAVVLNWQTTTEESTMYFDILRSADGANFTKIGTVQAANNNFSVKSYSFRDLQPMTSANFYRLRLVNQDHSIGMSRIVIVKFNSIVKLDLFPNPVVNTLNIQVQAQAGKVSLKLYDVSGRLVKESQLNSTGSSLSTTMYMGDLQKGAYFLKVNDEIMKVVKQ